MTENRIFEIILENNRNTNYNYDFPKLQPESANAAAEKFTDIIYETLKQKSTASHLKRGNILKYLRQMCRVKNCHLNEDSYDCFLKILRNSLQPNETGGILQLVSEINSELEKEVPQDLAYKMVDFYKRKNSKHKEKLKKLEFMNKMSQEKLDLKFNIQVRRNCSYYETSENVIRNLVGQTIPTEKKSSISQAHSVEYREKQIKFGYALLNLKNSDLCLIEAILQKLSTYKKLEEFEVNFLLYLFLVEDEVLNFSCIVADKFPLIFERLILKYATEILNLKEDAEVDQYFTDLEKDKKISKVRKACIENTVLSKTMISLIYVLYRHSVCNENVLRLIEFIK